MKGNIEIPTEKTWQFSKRAMDLDSEAYGAAENVAIKTFKI